MQPLALVKFMFELGGFLSGYKTYLVATAGALAVTAQFITGVLIPFIDGDLGVLALITEKAPLFIQGLAPFIGLGTLRAGVEKGNG